MKDYILRTALPIWMICFCCVPNCQDEVRMKVFGRSTRTVPVRVSQELQINKFDYSTCQASTPKGIQGQQRILSEFRYRKGANYPVTSTFVRNFKFGSYILVNLNVNYFAFYLFTAKLLNMMILIMIWMHFAGRQFAFRGRTQDTFASRNQNWVNLWN